jgi:hypothetical protein
MSLNWLSVNDNPPKDGQDCLVKMKHGIIQGTYNADDNSFSRYYFQDIEFYGHDWVPIEDLD